MARISAEMLSEMMARDIETAKTPERAIIIISEEECVTGLGELRKIFDELFPDPNLVSVIPILRSGLQLGKELTEPLKIEMNPMRMSYYKDDTSRLAKPICLMQPDITKIVTVEGKTLPVVFSECVVDSQETVIAAMIEINKMIDEIGVQTGREIEYPIYSTFAYVSKTGENPILIPNVIAAFKVHPDVWVGGLGCDLPGDNARELPYLVGLLSPFANEIPKRPYYHAVLTI